MYPRTILRIFLTQFCEFSYFHESDYYKISRLDGNYTLYADTFFLSSNFDVEKMNFFVVPPYEFQKRKKMQKNFCENWILKKMAIITLLLTL